MAVADSSLTLGMSVSGEGQRSPDPADAALSAKAETFVKSKPKHESQRLD
jgi:hypothetical protein